MSLLEKYPYIRKVFSNLRIFEVLYLLLLLIIPLQKYLQNHYNNFTIFRHSTLHFFAKTHLYAEYPMEHSDVFLYNPTFTILFAPFAYLPVFTGILCWVGFVLALFYFSIRMLPLSIKARLFILGFTFLELITSLENLQVNPAEAAFIIFTFIYLEKKEIFKASPFPAIGFFTKLIGGISATLFIVRRSKIKDYIWPLIWALVLLCLPLIFYSPQSLIKTYREWFNSLTVEHTTDRIVSMMSMVSAISGTNADPLCFQAGGTIMLIITVSYIFFRDSYQKVKWMFLAYIMIWITIFNHFAESATYIIASTGVAIWYLCSKRSWLDTTLLVITFLFTVMSPSDLFPEYLRKNLAEPYHLKALGPTLIWIKLQITLYLPDKTARIVTR